MQNDDVPKKGPRLDSPQARPSAKQPKEQAKAHPRGDPSASQGKASKDSIQDAVWAQRRNQGPPPAEGAAKAPWQGGLYSRDTVREEGNLTTLGKVRQR